MQLSIALWSLLVSCSFAAPSRVEAQPDKVRRQQASPTAKQCIYYTQVPKTGICGSKGTPTNPSRFGVAKTVYSVNSCAGACYNKAACRSFYYNEQSGGDQGTCQLFRESVKGLKLKPTSNNNALYYDKACFAQTCSCGNEGAQYAVYHNAATYTDATYSNFDPTVFKTQTPYYNYTVDGINDSIADNQGANVTIYGNPYPFSSDYFAINHRGYIFAPQAGNYTIYMEPVDDIGLLWVGPNAYSGYSRANVNAANYVNGNSASYSFNMTEGQYMPVRYIYGQATNTATWLIFFEAPTQSNSPLEARYDPLFVSHSCDGKTAPPFPPFGSET